MAYDEYDLTIPAVWFTYGHIQNMPGNPGQEVLTQRLITDGDYSFVIGVTYENEIEPYEVVSVDVVKEISFISSHPEAISIIIDHANMAYQEYSAYAQDQIQGFYEADDWFGLSQWLNEQTGIAEAAYGAIG